MATPSAPSALQAVLSHVAPFSRATPAARASFAAAAKRVPLRAGERAWRTGDPSRAFSFVWKGLVKLVRPRAGGRSDIIEIFGPGEAIGIISAMRGIAHPADAVAASVQAEIVEIPRADVLDAAARHPAFATAIADSCAGRALRMLDMHAILAAGSVEARLAAFLIDLAERFGDLDDDSLVRVPVALSRSELASCIATTTETAIRVMSKWSRAGLVQSYRQGFIISSIERLREVTDPSGYRVPRACPLDDDDLSAPEPAPAPAPEPRRAAR